MHTCRKPHTRVEKVSDTCVWNALTYFKTFVEFRIKISKYLYEINHLVYLSLKINEICNEKKRNSKVINDLFSLSQSQPRNVYLCNDDHVLCSLLFLGKIMETQSQ